MIRHLFIILVMAQGGALFGQTIKRFANDISIIKADNSGYGIYGLNLKDSLPDGKWQYYDTKDSLSKHWEEYLRMEGTYKKSLREGRFIYYHRSLFSHNKKNYYKRILASFYTYRRGLLNGPFCIFHSIYKEYEGYYNDGLKDGFFITYYTKEPFQNRVWKIESYKKDTLGEWAFYNPNGTKMASGHGDGVNITGEYFIYDDNGLLKSIGYFTKGVPYQYRIFDDDGKVEEEVSGNFFYEQRDYYIGNLDSLLRLNNGRKKYYSEGRLIKEVSYINGIPQSPK